MFQSRKVRLKLNQRQKELVTKNFGASRFIWNWGLEQLKNWWEQNKDLDKAEYPRGNLFVLNVALLLTEI